MNVTRAIVKPYIGICKHLPVYSIYAVSSTSGRARRRAMHKARARRILALSYGLTRDPELKAAPFEYCRAASLAEACALLATHGESVKLIAGGQSLVPMMAMRLVRPAWLVDINEIPELKFVKIEKDAARTGACARQCVVERDDATPARGPRLLPAHAWGGHDQTTKRVTHAG